MSPVVLSQNSSRSSTTKAFPLLSSLDTKIEDLSSDREVEFLGHLVRLLDEANFVYDEAWLLNLV